MKELEVEGVKLAEAGSLSEAIEKFSKTIELCPWYASGYNNRLVRIKKRGALINCLYKIPFI